MCMYLRVCKRYAGDSSVIDLQVLLDVGKMLFVRSVQKGWKQLNSCGKMTLYEKCVCSLLVCARVTLV